MRVSYRKVAGPFTRVHSNRIRGNDFKQKEACVRLDIRKKPLYCESDEALKQASHLWASSRPGWGFGQPGLMKGVPDSGRGLEVGVLQSPFQFKPFNDSMIL